LDALKAQSVAPNAILIYDDESTDGSTEWLKQHASGVWGTAGADGGEA
jgi:hypothetical protein